MAGVLTTNLVLQKTKLDNMKHVHKLNVCGVHVSDIGVLRDAPNVEVLSLSVNAIEDLSVLGDLPKLRELYLRKNHIIDLKQVLHLSKLSYLSNLNMSENPVSSDPSYRAFIIAALPNLARLDDVDIDVRERDDAENAYPNAWNQLPPAPMLPSSPPRATVGCATPRAGSARPSMESTMMQQPPPSRQGSAAAGGVGLAQRFEALSTAYDEMPVGGRRVPTSKRPLVAAHQQQQYAAQPRFGAAVAGAAPSKPSEDGVVRAVCTLLHELSPSALQEVRNHLDALMNA